MPDWPLLTEDCRAAALNAVTAHAARAITLAPFHVRFGVAVLSIPIGLALSLMSIGAGGPLVRSVRAARLYALLHYLPGPLSSVIRLYRSVALLAFYEHPTVAALLLPNHIHSGKRL